MKSYKQNSINYWCIRVITKIPKLRREPIKFNKNYYFDASVKPTIVLFFLFIHGVLSNIIFIKTKIKNNKHFGKLKNFIGPVFFWRAGMQSNVYKWKKKKNKKLINTCDSDAQSTITKLSVAVGIFFFLFSGTLEIGTSQARIDKHLPNKFVIIFLMEMARCGTQCDAIFHSVLSFRCDIWFRWVPERINF